MKELRDGYVVILIFFGAALLIASACNNLDGLQALAGVVCWGIAAKGSI